MLSERTIPPNSGEIFSTVCSHGILDVKTTMGLVGLVADRDDEILWVHVDAPNVFCAAADFVTDMNRDEDLAVHGRKVSRNVEAGLRLVGCESTCDSTTVGIENGADT